MRFLGAGKDGVENDSEDQGVNIEHDQQANATTDQSPQLEALVVRDAAGEVIRQLAMKNNRRRAQRNDEHTQKKPTNTKCIHIP